MAAVAGKYGSRAFSSSDGDSTTDYSGYVYAVLVTGGISLVGAALATWVLLKIPETLIKVGLLFSVVMAGVWMAIAFAYGEIGIGVMGAIFFAIIVCYAFAVWSRIPFATINLVTGCRAIISNKGVIGLAYLFALLAAGWTVLWSVAIAGAWDHLYGCDVDSGDCDDVSYGYLFLFLVAYFFTHQVLQNCIHV